jgi:flagellar secretion chaperone FliS
MHARSNAVAAYRSTALRGQLAAADPARLIQLMLEHAVGQVAVAKGALERRAIAAKGEAVSRAIALIDELNHALNMEQGGDIAVRLRDLYDYLVRRLVEANMRNDAAIFAEVGGLLREIKAGWDGIVGRA